MDIFKGTSSSSMNFGGSMSMKNKTPANLKYLLSKLNATMHSYSQNVSVEFYRELELKELTPTSAGCRRIKFRCPVDQCKAAVTVYLKKEVIRTSNFVKHLTKKHKLTKETDKHSNSKTQQPKQVKKIGRKENRFEPFKANETIDDFLELRDKLNLVMKDRYPCRSGDWEVKELELTNSGLRRIRFTCPVVDCDADVTIYIEKKVYILSNFTQHLAKRHDKPELTINYPIEESEHFQVKNEPIDSDGSWQDEYFELVENPEYPSAQIESINFKSEDHEETSEDHEETDPVGFDAPTHNLLEKLYDKLNKIIMDSPSQHEVKNKIEFTELTTTAAGFQKVSFHCPLNGCIEIVKAYIKPPSTFQVTNFKRHIQRHDMNRLNRNHETLHVSKRENGSSKPAIKPPQKFPTEVVLLEEVASSNLEKCRLCLINDKREYFITLSPSVSEMFHEVTGMKLNQSKLLPPKICLSCDAVLKKFSNIKDVFIKNQEQLHELLLPNKGGVSVKETQEVEDISEKEKPMDNDYDLFDTLEPLSESDEDSQEDIFMPEPRKQKTEKNKNLEPEGRKKENAEVMHICHMCSFQTKNVQRLRNHIRRHEPHKNFGCDQCVYSSRNKEQMRSHMRSHLPKNDTRALRKCRFKGCDDATFRFGSSVGRHFIRFHSKERPFGCNLCSKRYPTKYYLSKHVKRVHLNREAK